MVEIVYRIYRKRTEEEKIEILKKNNSLDFYIENGWSSDYSEKEEIALDCLICEDREQFKEIIKENYGKDIKFRYSKNIKEGEYYCIIIGDHCWNTEKYFNRVEYECDNCHTKVKGFVNAQHTFSEWEIKTSLANDQSYLSKKFCSARCMEQYRQIEKAKIYPDENNLDMWVTRDSFSKNHAGYIYKITKKSTGEFYIGQTIYAPVFRWAEHLKTERFKIDNILDYQFETIEIVPFGTNILEREKFWIQKYYLENPKLSLNISNTKNVDLQYKMELGENINENN